MEIESVQPENQNTCCRLLTRRGRLTLRFGRGSHTKVSKCCRFTQDRPLVKTLNSDIRRLSQNTAWHQSCKAHTRQWNINAWALDDLLYLYREELKCTFEKNSYFSPQRSSTIGPQVTGSTHSSYINCKSDCIHNKPISFLKKQRHYITVQLHTLTSLHWGFAWFYVLSLS